LVAQKLVKTFEIFIYKSLT